MSHHAPRGVLAAALLVGAAACGAPPPAEEGRLVWRVPNEPASLDPAKAANADAQRVIRRTHEGLTIPDPATGAPLPGLAARWEIGEAGTRYVFHLRPGARFHDGAEVVAADAVYSLARHFDPATGSVIAPWMEAVQGGRARLQGDAGQPLGIRALDPRTVELRLERAYAPMLQILSMAPAAIVRAGAAGGGIPERGLAGTGPFTVAAWERGRFLSLAAFPDYWGGAPRLAAVTFRLVDDSVTALAQYEAGELDVLMGLPDARREQIADERGGELRTSALYGLYSLGINHAQAPLADNLPLRRALEHALDRDYICRVLQKRKNRPAWQIAPPDTLGWDAELRGNRFDLDAARAMLREAGYPEGRGLRPLTVAYPVGNATYRDLLQRFRADLSEIGVSLTLQAIEWAEFSGMFARGAPAFEGIDLFRVAWVADYADPDSLFTPLLDTASIGVAANVAYRDPEMDDLLEQARTEADRDRRGTLYRRAARRAWEEVALIPVYWPGEELLVRPGVEGIALGPLGESTVPLQQVTVRR